MWKILHGQTSNDLQIQFHKRSRLGTQAVTPSLSRGSSSKHQSMYDNSFAVLGPKLWNAMPTSINVLYDVQYLMPTNFQLVGNLNENYLLLV